MEQKNINPKTLEKNFTSVQDFINYMLGEQIFTVEKENELSRDLNQVEKCSYNKANVVPKIDKNYMPQIGDEVIITDEQFKGTKGKIIAEVDLYDSYQIQVSDINALYIPRNKVKVIKKKDDSIKEETIKKLKDEIHITKTEQQKLINKLNGLDFKLDNLYKQLEQYGIHNEFCEF